MPSASGFIISIGRVLRGGIGIIGARREFRFKCQMAGGRFESVDVVFRIGADSALRIEYVNGVECSRTTTERKTGQRSPGR